jgi:hypothetical protein
MAVLRLIPASGKAIEIKTDAALVGREPTCDVVITDGSVSRKHARLERHPQCWSVIDQGSANGTFVDSQRVGEATVRSGQDVRFGAVTFRVEVEGQEDLGATMVSGSPDATVVAATPLRAPAPVGPVTPPLGSPPPAPPPPAPPPPPLPKAGPPPIARAAAPPPLPPRAAAPSPLPPRAAAPHPPSASAARDRFGGGAPAPVGQMSAPEVPGKKGKSPIFWMVTGCCGCLLLLVLIAVLGGGAVFYSTQAPASAVHAQLQQLRQGDVDGVYRKLSDEYRAQISPEGFADLVRQHQGLRANRDATFWKRNISNDRATLSGTLSPESGSTEIVTFELVKQGGDWRISAIHFGLGSD